MEGNGIIGILADGWANASTVDAGNATGNFYRILPDGDETTGDFLTLTRRYTAYD